MNHRTMSNLVGDINVMYYVVAGTVGHVRHDRTASEIVKYLHLVVLWTLVVKSLEYCINVIDAVTCIASFLTLTIPPFPQIDIIGAVVIVWRARGKLSGLFCAVLCATSVHSEVHTHMNRTNSSLDWVLSHWAHFTVLRFIFVYVLFCVWLYIACMCTV